MKKLLPTLLLLIGTAGLDAADPWARALSPRVWSFPRDHGAHPEFKTEWWYFTGNLEDSNHHPYGYELTFFRHGLQTNPTQPNSAWSIRDIAFAHLAVTDVQSRKFLFAEKLSRGALGEVEISQKDMQVPTRWLETQSPARLHHDPQRDRPHCQNWIIPLLPTS